MWLIFVIFIAFVIYWKLIKPLNYWKERGIVGVKPWPLVGNMGPAVFRKKPIFEVALDLYFAYPDQRYIGIYQFMSPTLLIRDLDLIKQITVKYFDHFTDHNSLITEEMDPLMGKNLFFLKGQRWRDMRATLSPSFTSSKMRGMFALLSDCAQQFTDYFEKEKSDISTVEMKDLFTRFTNDAIASVAFGLKVDSLKERDNEFYLMGKDATDFSGWRTLKFSFMNMSPMVSKLLGMTFFPTPVGNFFRRIVNQTIQRRKSEGLIRPDMIHLLMEAQKGHVKQEEAFDATDAGFATAQESSSSKGAQRAKLTDEDIVAQALVFFFAGFDTSSTLMCFMAHELAMNPLVLEKLQEEVDATLESCSGKITYEALLGMKYMDMVVSETLRKWPPGFRLDRLCVKEFLIEPSKPDEAPVTIQKGTLVEIPVGGIQRDPNHFPDPDKFDPERFSEENKHNIVPYSFLPFGSGPRSCIASRFALLENKALFFHFLSKFDLVTVEKTMTHLKLGTKTLGMVPDDGFWLGLRPRKVHKN